MTLELLISALKAAPGVCQWQITEISELRHERYLIFLAVESERRAASTRWNVWLALNSEAGIQGEAAFTLAAMAIHGFEPITYRYFDFADDGSLHYLTDADIAKSALQMLAWDTVVPKDHVKVTVRDGWMTLEGEVDWEYQRTDAERAVRYLSGVKGVINTVTLKHRAVPADVKAKIEAALKRSAESDAQHISVEVHDGTATLSGKVHTFAARDEAALAAWAAPGVRMVTDHILVTTDFGAFS